MNNGNHPESGLNIIELKEDGNHFRCPECHYNLFEFGDNHIVGIDDEMLEEMKNNIEEDDPLYDFYNELNFNELPQKKCPDCAQISDWKRKI